VLASSLLIFVASVALRLLALSFVEASCDRRLFTLRRISRSRSVCELWGKGKRDDDEEEER